MAAKQRRSQRRKTGGIKRWKKNAKKQNKRLTITAAVSEMPSVRCIDFLSLLPQYWETKMAVPEPSPKITQLKSQLNCDAIPTDDRAVSPSPAIIKVSTMEEDAARRFWKAMRVPIM